MGNFWGTFGWPLLVFGGGAFIYFGIVKPKLDEAARTLGKADTVAASTGFAKLWASLAGYKTVLATGLGFIPQLFTPEAVSQFQVLPWGSFVDQATANKIMAAGVFLGWIAHAYGLAKAAATPPKV